MAETAPLLGNASGLKPATYGEIAKHFGALGWTAFGGPNAHVGMYQELFVNRLHWLDNQLFAEIMALGQCLPGPTSTQMSFAIGIYKKGVRGGLLSGLLFLMPGAIIMSLLGLGSTFLTDISIKGTWQNCIASGLSAVGLSLVAVAAKNLTMKLCVTNMLVCLCAASAVITLCVKGAWLFPVVILSGGLATLTETLIARRGKFARPDSADGQSTVPTAGLGVPAGIVLLILWLVILVGSTTAIGVVEYTYDTELLFLFQAFFMIGSVVYGGGPVVLPMLLTVLCDQHHWLTNEEFLTGLGIAQAMPGPMFNLSAYVGAIIARNMGHAFISGSLVSWLGMFLPGAMLIFAVMPLWNYFRRFSVYQAMLPGLNVAASGLIVSSVFSMYDIARSRSPHPSVTTCISLMGAVAVDALKIPAPLVVLGGGGVGVLAWALGLNH